MKLDEVAKLAGVSRTTASYVINGKARAYRVSERTIEKVMAIVQAHNFKPNPVAASLRAGHTNTIGLIIPDLENISYAKIATRFEALCRQAGYQLFISCSNDDAENEKQCAKQLLARKIDALVVSTALGVNDPFYQQCTTVPVIGFDRQVKNRDGINILYQDQDDSFRLAETLLRTHPTRSILYFGAQSDFAISQRREAGFRQALQAAETRADYLYAPHFTRESAGMVFEQWLLKNALPETLFVTSMTLLQGVFQALLKRDGHIPPNLVIATFGDQQMLDLLPNATITAGQPYQTLAEQLLVAVKKCSTKDPQTENNSALYPILLQRDIVIKQ